MRDEFGVSLLDLFTLIRIIDQNYKPRQQRIETVTDREVLDFGYIGIGIGIGGDFSRDRGVSDGGRIN